MIFRARSGGGFFGGAEQKPPEAGFFGGALEADGEELGGDLEDDPSTLQLDQVEEVDIPSSRDMGDIFASTLSIADTEVSSYLTHQPPSRTNLVRPQDLMGAATAPPATLSPFQQRQAAFELERQQFQQQYQQQQQQARAQGRPQLSLDQIEAMHRANTAAPGGGPPMPPPGMLRGIPPPPPHMAPRGPMSPACAASAARHEAGGPQLPARGRAWAWARLLPHVRRGTLRPATPVSPRRTSRT